MTYCCIFLYLLISTCKRCFIMCAHRAERAWPATTWPTAGQASSWWWRTATPSTTSTSPVTALTASMWCPHAAASRPSTASRLYTGAPSVSLPPVQTSLNIIFNTLKKSCIVREHIGHVYTNKMFPECWSFLLPNPFIHLKFNTIQTVFFLVTLFLLLQADTLVEFSMAEQFTHH